MISIIGNKIIDAIINGAISPESGDHLICILDSQRKLIEQGDIDMSRKLGKIIKSQNFT